MYLYLFNDKIITNKKEKAYYVKREKCGVTFL